MTVYDNQLTLSGESDEYAAFVEKFKPKKTTDDCYTPPQVYEAVAGWVASEYGVNRDAFVRPFWPGGDFERFDYQDGCVVVDNPPFSTLSKIVKWYVGNDIKFFLFAPTLTNLSCYFGKTCHVITSAEVVYENGARVNTSFITNLDQLAVRTAPELKSLVEAASDEACGKSDAPKLPVYSYPSFVTTAATIAKFAERGIDYRLRREECAFIRSLDSQRQAKKAIFGGGLLLSREAAAREAAAREAAAREIIPWELSEREWGVVDSLGGR